MSNSLSLSEVCGLPYSSFITPILIDVVIAKTSQIIPCSTTLAADRVIPPLGEFVKNIIHMTETLPVTILSAMVLLDKLKEKLPSKACGTAETCHRVFLAALILANKLLYDVPLKNIAWSEISSLYSLTEINLMERQFLTLLSYQTTIEEVHIWRHLKNIVNHSSYRRLFNRYGYQSPTLSSALHKSIYSNSHTMNGGSFGSSSDSKLKHMMNEYVDWSQGSDEESQDFSDDAMNNLSSSFSDSSSMSLYLAALSQSDDWNMNASPMSKESYHSHLDNQRVPWMNGVSSISSVKNALSSSSLTFNSPKETPPSSSFIRTSQLYSTAVNYSTDVMTSQSQLPLGSDLYQTTSQRQQQQQQQSYVSSQYQLYTSLKYEQEAKNYLYSLGPGVVGGGSGNGYHDTISLQRLYHHQAIPDLTSLPTPHRHLHHYQYLHQRKPLYA